MNLINDSKPLITINEKHFTEEKLFPSSPLSIPSEVLKSLVIDYLLPKESSRMMEVNLSWHHLIKSDKSLYKEKIFIPYCLFQADLFASKVRDPYHRAVAFLNFAKIDSQHDVTKAKSAANELFQNFSNFHKKSKILFKITKFEAVYNLPEAIKTAQSIADPAFLTNALLEIAKLDPLHDITPAIHAAQNIDNSFKKYEALFTIAKFDPLHDLTQTKLAALSMPQLLKLRAFTEIAIFEAQNSVAGARETLEIYPETNESKVLSAIAKIEAINNIKLARKTAKTIKNPIIRAETLLEIAKIDPQHNLKKVKEAVKEIDDPEELFELLLKISKIDPENDLNELIQAAQNIEDYFEQVDAILKTAEIYPSHDLSNVLKSAQKSAKKIENVLTRFNFFKMIAKFDHQHNFSLAKQTAQILTDYRGNDQSKALYEIVQLEILYDLFQANQTAQSINSPYYKIMALLEIAKVDPSHDFSQVIEMTLKLNNKEKSDVLRNIVMIQALFDITQAKITALKIENHDIRLRAFLEIAKIEVHDDLIQTKVTSQYFSPNEDSDISAAFLELASLAEKK